MNTYHIFERMFLIGSSLNTEELFILYLTKLFIFSFYLIIFFYAIFYSLFYSFYVNFLCCSLSGLEAGLYLLVILLALIGDSDYILSF
jgi:hypothetical protein